ncbi:CAMK family protein kinase [Niveomyces insectorum RCEF 264]|uniref:non-specific serine/threonine protein kinase n=1 Tax=Niveomyces insectorum RCEF 264 TaxID=1081102 RepID=A0A167TUI3_9HYPO|nr:CAMK family protein kinase [Niveomyces insectorum RCEF 264]
MAFTDVIFALYPLSSTDLSQLLKKEANDAIFIKATKSSDIDSDPELDNKHDVKEPIPGETPVPDSPSVQPDWRDGGRFEFRWDRNRENQVGFVLGAAESMCDMVLPSAAPTFSGVSAVHGLITFDDQNRLVFRDLRDPDRRGDGSAVTYDGRGGEKRRGFSWLLSGTEYLLNENPNITLALHERLKFRVFVPPFDHDSEAHKAKVAAFRSREKQNNPSVLDSALRSLSFDHSNTTALPSGVQTISRGPIFLEDSQPLGCGSFGIVKRMYNVTRGIYFARKIPFGRLSKKRRTLWEREVRLLSRTQEASNLDAEARDYSRYVVQLLQGSMLPEPVIDLEYVPYGSLFSQHEQWRLSLDEILAVLEQVLKALTFLHGLRPAVAHRDIKPGNVLVQHRNLDATFADGSYRDSSFNRNNLIHIKLADFGLSKDEDLTTFGMGTPRYMAPELHGARMADWNCSRPTYTPSVDIWAVGVMVFDLAHELPREAQKRHISGQRRCELILQAVNDRDSDLAIFVAQHMVLWEPNNRLSARACLAQATKDLFIGADAATTAPEPAGDSGSSSPAAPESTRPPSSAGTARPLPSSKRELPHPSSSRRLQTTSWRVEKHARDDEPLAPPSRRRRSSASVSTASSSLTGDDGDELDNSYADDDGTGDHVPLPPQMRLHIHDVHGDPQASFVFGGSSVSRSEFSENPKRDDSSGWPQWDDKGDAQPPATRIAPVASPAADKEPSNLNQDSRLGTLTSVELNLHRLAEATREVA